jgi:hypothetical protein
MSDDKVIVSKEIGGDGATVALATDASSIKLVLAYPKAKLVDPILKGVDSGIDKAETLIPGDWDKAILEPLRALIKAEIAAALAGVLP